MDLSARGKARKAVALDSHTLSSASSAVQSQVQVLLDGNDRIYNADRCCLVFLCDFIFQGVRVCSYSFWSMAPSLTLSSQTYPPVVIMLNY